MVTRLWAPMISLVWANLAMAVLRMEPGPVVMIVVLSYIFIGCGLPVAAVLDPVIRGEETAAPRRVLVVLLTLASSFAASALGGQPLIWTGQWTATRQVVAAMVAGFLIAVVVSLSGRAGSES